MPPVPLTASDKRRAFRAGLASGQLLRVPGAFSPLAARLIEDEGFDGIYLSGAVLSAELGLPDPGFTPLDEVAGRGHQIARATDLPSLIDVEDGFGAPINAARTLGMLEDLGFAGCFIADRPDPGCGGRFDQTGVVETVAMVRRISAAVEARRDADFVLCARTDASAGEGLNAAIARAKAYRDVGADLIFAEAVADERGFEAFRRALPDTPLLASMAEFAPAKLLTARTLRNLGINIVIYPATLLRLAMASAEVGLKTIQIEGSQASVIERMQPRARLHDLLCPREGRRFDAGTVVSPL